jgi:3-oxoacyl-[acyl-carrier-protein] synthase-3
MPLKARVVGMGSYLPEKILTNQDLERLVDTNDEWITTRTGIKERRIAATEEFASDMGAKAAFGALEQARLTPDDIDMILVATMSPDNISPSTAVLLQHKIGATRAAAMDLQAACTGFLYALSVAKAYVESGMFKRVLVVASEKMSAFVDYEDRSTCILFGDGAGAAVIAAEGKGLQIDSLCLGACGEMADLLFIPAGGACKPATHETVDKREHFIKMEGNKIFKHAVRGMTAAANECLAIAGLKDSDLSWIVPHQANIRIIDATTKNFAISPDRVYKTISKYGNTSASGIAIALHELLQENSLEVGEHILLVAFGGGLTWGASVLTQK